MRHITSLSWVVVAMLALGSGSFEACALAQSRDTPGVIIVGTKEAPPFVIKGDDGPWRGIIDLWRSMADELEPKP